MKYTVDKENKYNEEILKYLRAYNIVHTGVKSNEKTHIYILDNKKLVGALTISLDWDWVSFSEYFYFDFEVLKLMISKISKLYKDSASGISVYTNVVERINDFRKLGFEVEGILQSATNAKNEYSLSYYKLDMKSDLDFEVIVNEKAILEYESILKEQVVTFKAKHKIETKKDELIIVALDNDIFAGGVKVIIYDSSMYIDLLVVKEEYRGKNIGSKLMELAEVEANNRNLYSIDLGTAEFQAREFYEKLGYTTVITKKDQPKGFNCYTLVKKLR